MPGRKHLSPEQQAVRQARAEELRKWRLSAPMEKYKALAKQYKDAGVTIHIVKFGLNTNMPDEEIDYCFNVALAPERSQDQSRT
jgi:hypothetical protein